jgi:hypothetical protein
MSDILDAAVDYIASTTRWSGDADRICMQGTLWYGTMCRSFLLLERMLRLSLAEVSRVAPSEIEKASESRASNKPLRALTFGQCVGVLEAVAPTLPDLLVNAYPSIHMRQDMLPDNDRIAWNRVVSLRNRMTHKGPGFLDSIDLRAGRIWREYDLDEPLDQQAKEIWAIGRQLCRSPFILTCIAIQGCDEKTSIAKFMAAEARRFTLHEMANVSERAIDTFHAA